MSNADPHVSKSHLDPHSTIGMVEFSFSSFCVLGSALVTEPVNRGKGCG